MENIVLSWVTSTLQWCATKYFHCIMIPKACRPFRQTHPVVFCFVPLQTSVSSKLRTTKKHFSPLERDAFISSTQFIQASIKGKDPLPSHSTKPREGWKKRERKKKKNKSGPRENQKASTTYIWSVFMSFSIHSGPPVGFNGLSDVTNQVDIHTWGLVQVGPWRWKCAKKRQLVWDQELRLWWRKQEMTHLMWAESPVSLISQRPDDEEETECGGMVKLSHQQSAT